MPRTKLGVGAVAGACKEFRRAAVDERRCNCTSCVIRQQSWHSRGATGRARRMFWLDQLDELRLAEARFLTPIYTPGRMCSLIASGVNGVQRAFLP